MPTYVSVLRISQMIRVWRATVEYILTGEKRRTRRKTCPSATLSTTNPTWIETHRYYHKNFSATKQNRDPQVVPANEAGLLCCDADICNI
jgi:hypothetical protein